MASKAVQLVLSLRRRIGVGVISVLICVVGVALSATASWRLRSDIARTHADRLAESAAETTTLFTTVAENVAGVLTTACVVAGGTDGNVAAFANTVRPRLQQSLLSNAVLLERRGDRFMQRTWVGRRAPVLLQHLGRSGQQSLRRVADFGRLFIVARGTRATANVLGIAAAPRPHSKYVVYSEVSIPGAVSFGNLQGIDYAFYLGKEAPDRLFTSNTSRLPIRGRRLVTRIDSAEFGQQPFLVFGGMRTSTLSSIGPWLLLALGSLISLTLAAQYEGMRRRRDTALVLVDELAARNDELDRQSALNRHQALHDALTGLPNRTLFLDRIEQAIRHAGREGGGAAVVMIDVDDFKEVNEGLGHQSGDVLLKTIAARLSASIRPSDTVARLGGDEFGILIHSIDDREDPLTIATKLHEVFADPVVLSDLGVEVDASVGIALYSAYDATPDALLRHADVALYRSKEIHTPTAYSTELDHYSATRLRLITGLRGAIENGEIIVYYQPQALARTGEIEAVETLVRWQHPELGLIPPQEFIALAERTGTIRLLTRHVLSTALAQCRDWIDRGWHLGIAVNICSRDLHDASFPDEVMTALRTADIDPAMLELEITEGTILTDPARARAVVEQLARQGVRFAIDDFGTGQSSLAYLKRLPIHVLKIDKSFVLGMARDPDDDAIVRSTIELAHNLHLKVIAEGVETPQIRDQLVTLDCDVLQGYEIGRPSLPAELETLLTRPHPDPAEMKGPELRKSRVLGPVRSRGFTTRA